MIKNFLKVFFGIILINSLCVISSCEYDIAVISSITPSELYEGSPEWCKPYVDDIILLSVKHNISAEFAVSVFRYEYVESRNSVGGWKPNGEYSSFDTVEQSISHWFSSMEKTYANIESWHYEKTGGTLLENIAPLYNQGVSEPNEKSKLWYDKIKNQWDVFIDLNQGESKMDNSYIKSIKESDEQALIFQ